MWTMLQSPMCALLALLILMVSTSHCERRTVTNNTADITTMEKPSVPDKHVIIHEFQELKLNCTGSPSSTATWTKDGIKIEASNGNMSHFILNHNELVVAKVNSSAVGDYECRNGDTSARFIVRAKPRVKFNINQLQRSQTVVVFETWTIGCQFVDKFYAHDAQINLMRCKKEDTMSKPWCGRPNRSQLIHETQQWVQTNQARVTVNATATENGTFITLSIARAHYQDIAAFVCDGINSDENSNATILLRVRDRYDFVWPMVLLTGLALYLCGLVIVFETRRIRPTSFIKVDK